MQDPAPAIQNIGSEGGMAPVAASAASAATPVQAPSASPPARRTRTKKAAKRVNGTGTAAPTDPDAPLTVNISLPGEIYRFFEQEAAEDERTLAKYLQRVLKGVWQQKQSQKEYEDGLIRTEKNLQSGVE